MFIDLDKNLEDIASRIRPCWTEIVTEKRFLTCADPCHYASTEFIMIGKSSLSCSVEAETVPNRKYDYFPLYLTPIEASELASDKWQRLARAGGDSDLDRRLQWMFREPRIRLITKEESFADSMRDDANWETLRFYGGIEFSDPASDKFLRLVATDSTDFPAPSYDPGLKSYAAHFYRGAKSINRRTVSISTLG